MLLRRSSKTLLAFMCSLLLVLTCAVIAYTGAPKIISQKEAQNLIRHMAGIELPSSAVRVKDISGFGSSAVVVAEVETAFRLNKEADGKWKVAEIRTGDRKWEDVGLLVRALDREKTARARAELGSLAVALESFRRERGFYVEAKDAAVLTDQLNPRYIKEIVRVDPWHRAYRYTGTAALYTLSSDGPDGKPDTADDIVKRNP